MGDNHLENCRNLLKRRIAASHEMDNIMEMIQQDRKRRNVQVVETSYIKIGREDWHVSMQENDIDILWDEEPH
jgi:hypothetical protein